MSEKLKFFLTRHGEDARPQELELENDGSTEVVVGRGKKCDFVVDHSSISWTHLKFRAQNSTLTVRDVSSNGCGLQAPSNPSELQVLRKDEYMPVPDGAVLVLPKRVHISVCVPEPDAAKVGKPDEAREGTGLTDNKRAHFSSDDDLEAMEAKLGVGTSKAAGTGVVTLADGEIARKTEEALAPPQVDRPDEQVESRRSQSQQWEPADVVSGLASEQRAEQPDDKLDEKNAAVVEAHERNRSMRVDPLVVEKPSAEGEGGHDSHERFRRSQDGEHSSAERRRSRSLVRVPVFVSVGRSVPRLPGQSEEDDVESNLRQQSRTRSPVRASVSVDRQEPVHPELPSWVQEGQHAQWWSQSKAVMLPVHVSKIDAAKRVVIAIFDTDGSSWKSVPFSMLSRKDCPLHPLPGKLQPSKASPEEDVQPRRRSRTPDWWEEEKRKQRQAASELKAQQEAEERESKEAFERHLEEQKRKALMEAERKKVEEAFERRKKEAEALQLQEEEAWRQRLREEREKEAAEEEEARKERKKRREAERRERKEAEKEKKHQEMEAEKMKKQQQAEEAFEEVLLSGHKKEEQMHQQRLGHYPQQATASGSLRGAPGNPAMMGISAGAQQMSQHMPCPQWGIGGGMEQWHAGQWSSVGKGCVKGSLQMSNGKGQPWGVSHMNAPVGNKGGGSTPPSWPTGGGMTGLGASPPAFRPPMSYRMPGPPPVQGWR